MYVSLPKKIQKCSLLNHFSPRHYLTAHYSFGISIPLKIFRYLHTKLSFSIRTSLCLSQTRGIVLRLFITNGITMLHWFYCFRWMFYFTELPPSSLKKYYILTLIRNTREWNLGSFAWKSKNISIRLLLPISKSIQIIYIYTNTKKGVCL